jgi:hypothetical protein
VPALHHQAVKQTGNGLVTVAWAADQVIEAVELEGHKFTVGIQWHPEEGHDQRVLQALVAAASPAPPPQEAQPAANGKDSNDSKDPENGGEKAPTEDKAEGKAGGKPAPAASTATR